jgi:O-methyltransferase involved in polyketide biosynthesis
MADLETVNFAGVQQTALALLHSKALDSRRPDSILGDREADNALRRIDYDFGKLRISRRDEKPAAARAKTYDGWVKRFLDVQPECVVLHLACGLDTRFYRVNPPPTVDWYDIDLPDVIQLRRRLYPQRAGLYTIAASITDPRLLDTIPAHKPVLVVAEGITPYLRAADGIATLRRIIAHFPSGELVFDGWSRAGVRWLVAHFGPVKASGAQVDWSIDDPHELETAVPGLVFDCEWRLGDATEVKRHYSWLSWQLEQVLFRIRPIRRLRRGLRYHFGHTSV